MYIFPHVRDVCFFTAHLHALKNTKSEYTRVHYAYDWFYVCLIESLCTVFGKWKIRTCVRDKYTIRFFYFRADCDDDGGTTLSPETTTPQSSDKAEAAAKKTRYLYYHNAVIVIAIIVIIVSVVVIL